MRSSIQRLLRGSFGRFGRFGVSRIASSGTKTRRRIDVPPALIYAIGDVHGCYDELCRLEDAIVRDGLQHDGPKFIITLGDYVDRGPASAQVLARLQSDMPAGFQRICLCGNHEAMMLDFLEQPHTDSPWMRFGGETTIRSYGIDIHWLRRMDSGKALTDMLLDAIPPEDIEFLKNLPVLARMEDLVFVHAGLRPGVSLDQQRDDDLLWIRQPFLDQGAGLPLTVIHGHTPVERPTLKNGHVCLDTGAYSTGRLTGLRLMNGEMHLL